MKSESLVTDFRKSQMVSGLTAASTIFFGALLTLFIPIPPESKAAILYVALGLAAFTGVYYLIAGLYANKRLEVLPDIFFIIGLSVIVLLAGGYGYLYIAFFMLIVAVDAFIFSLSKYTFVVLASVLGILFGALWPDLVLEAEYVFGVYVLSALAVVLRIFASEAIEVKNEKEGLAEAVTELEGDKREIRQLLESLSDGMFVVDAKNKITFYNRAALKILGIVADEKRILGRDLNDFMPTVGSQGAEAVTKEAFSSLEHSVRNDLRIVKPERTLRLHTNVSPVIAERDLQGAIIFFRDITKEQRLEEQRAEFNAVASHELRTPLSVIEGYLFYVLDPTSKLKYDAETKEYIERAFHASRDLNRLVTDILTVVRAEEGELEVCLKKVEPKEFIQKIVDNYVDEAEEKGLKLSFKVVTKKTIPEIETDPVKLKEIVSNLVGNAIKFTEKGKIKVELGLLKNEIIVTVIDSGPGIEKENIGNIFRKYYRVESWKNKSIKGTGLGLYIVKILAERLGGRASVHSEVGVGSKFYFTLPIDFEDSQDGKKANRKDKSDLAEKI